MSAKRTYIVAVERLIQDQYEVEATSGTNAAFAAAQMVEPTRSVERSRKVVSAKPAIEEA